MRKVFIDEAQENKFQKEGYVHIPFLSKEEAEGLKQTFFDLLPISGGNISGKDIGLEDGHDITYDFTFIDKNQSFKEAVFEEITKVFMPKVDKVLDNYRPIIANFIRKQHTAGEVPLHENWAFVDEHKATSVSIWCPLVDSNEQNGTLQVVPGSHKRFGEIRGPKIPWELEAIKHDIIANDLVPCNLTAGDAIVLDDSIVHYSAINKTDELRLAIQLILLPAEMPSVHHHMNPAESMSKVEVLEVDKDFYMAFNPWKNPDAVKVVKKLHFELPQLSYADYRKRIYGKRYDNYGERSSIFSKFKSLIGA